METTALEKARLARQQMQERGEKIERRNPIEKAKDNPKSRALAINGMCFDCQGRDADSSWQWRVGNCTSRQCPLYPVRPHQRLYETPIPAGLRVAGEK